MFEGDHISVFDANFIQLIDKRVKKGLFLQDDYMYHYINRITASACDFVLTACPLSNLKFKELGYKSFFYLLKRTDQSLKTPAKAKFMMFYFLEELKTIEAKQQNI